MCFVGIMRFVLMRVFDALADEYSGQVAEDKCLDRPYEQFEQEHEYSERK